MKVTKEFKFESAHRLSDYEGKCKRIHGHNYRGIVIVENDVLDKKGMVMDFSDLKKIIKDLIITPFDHRLILKNTPENKHLFREFDSDWLAYVEYNPTAENMAEDFADRIAHAMNFKVSVQLFETDDSSAIAR